MHAPRPALLPSALAPPLLDRPPAAPTRHARACEQVMEKNADCMTKCNMLPNCSSVCPAVILATDAAVTEGLSAEDAYIECCVPSRVTPLPLLFPLPLCLL